MGEGFDFFDVDGDGFGEYVFIDNGILYLYDRNGKEMFTKDFSSSKLGGPINFTFSSADRKIGVFDADRNLIYLIDSKGEIMDGTERDDVISERNKTKEKEPIMSRET